MTAAASDLLVDVASFTAGNDGALRISAAQVELVPAGNMFFEVRITAGNGTSITVVAHESALKVTNTTCERASAEHNISDSNPAGVSIARLAALK